MVIPVFNEERGLNALFGELKPVLDATGMSWEVTFVDDGSKDGTGDAARAAGARVITQPVNRGKGRALARGFTELTAAGYHAVITLDADGQHDPTEMTRLIARARETRADLVVGSRMRNTRGMPWLRVVVNHSMSWFISALAGQRVEDSQSGYRLHRARLLRALTLVTDRYETETEILIKAGRRGFRIASAPITTIYGDEKSGINPWVDSIRFVRLLARSVLWW